MSPGKRLLIAKDRGYLSSAGPQSRFIVFLLFILVIYTLLLRVFQKLAEIVGLPVFLPISLITLLIFIGIAGTLYSHKFIGPMSRMRRVIEQMADGDMTISLRLRESDDPAIKDLAKAIRLLCDHSRDIHVALQNSAHELFGDIQILREKIQQGADINAIRAQVESIVKRQGLLDKAITSLSKGTGI